MRRILAIAFVSIRNAIRSRMVISLLGLLAVAVVSFPLGLKGDGTAEGQLRITITYSLSAAFGLLALASLWAGALSISREIEECQIQMLASKPVRAVEVWVGKWIGLMLVNGVLLAVAAFITAVLLPRELLEAQSPAGVSWRAVFLPVEPIQPDVEQEARSLLDERVRSGLYPTNVATERALQLIRQELLAKAGTVPPGQRRDWRFTLPRPPGAGEDLILRFRASSGQLSLNPIGGRWTISRGGPDAVWEKEATFIPMTVQNISVPGEALAGAGEIVVSFINVHESYSTVVFDAKDGVRVLLPAGSFYGNYGRAVLLLFLRLGFLTAVGVTAGALFSAPVALFMSVGLLLMAQLAGYTAEFPAETAAGRALDQMAEIVRIAFRPLRAPPALDSVATGLRVRWVWLGRVALVQWALYGAVVMALGAGVLARRELALPQR